MINRQRALIRLISNENGCITKLRLVKLSFVMQATALELPRSSLYEFVPYNHGPYSFTLTHELRAVERDGWIRISDSEIKLLRSADAETAKMGSFCTKEIDTISRRYKRMTTPTLVAQVYNDYPWYTARAKNVSLRRADVPTVAPMIFTVGYEGLMLDGLLDLLLRSGVKRLIDVRKNPVARRFGFHKSTMERHCQDVGISYVHVPELGIPSEQRTDLIGPDSYIRLFEFYEKAILPLQQVRLEAVASMVREESSALMCMEADSTCCHRSRLANAVAHLTKLPIKELRVP